jgi:DNA-binding CsgD family transcriptional regulator
MRNPCVHKSRIYLKGFDRSKYLTPQEARCVYYAIKGCTYKQIAEEMNLSWRTVEFHLRGVGDKFGFHGKGQIVREIKKGLLSQ